MASTVSFAARANGQGFSGTTSTFSGLSIGTASSDRIVAVGVILFLSSAAGDQSASLAVTVGGISATRAASSAGTNGQANSCIYAAAVPTGTTANIVVTASGGAEGNILLVSACTWAITGVSATSSAAAGSGGSPLSMDCNSALDSVGIGCGQAQSGGFTWTGATEDFDTTDGGSFQIVSGASFVGSTTQTPRTISASIGAGGDRSGSFAVFPAVAPAGQPTIKRSGGVEFMHGRGGFGRGGKVFMPERRLFLPERIAA